VGRHTAIELRGRPDAPAVYASERLTPGNAWASAGRVECGGCRTPTSCSMATRYGGRSRKSP